ncbi:MAG: DUF3343 domain-containing protein [Blautia sp.]|nr:DUF3343 domain-containing protein [Blautia sp.]MDY3998225.1 DUF3343 domain-containing protein [Blautia sp.]
MNEYIATFYSHFGAVCFKRACAACNVPAVIMPVPRSLSSSCGTCVKFQAGTEQDFPEKNEEIEQIVRVDGGRFVRIYEAEE